MNFQICSEHSDITPSQLIRTGTILDFPEELQVQLKCDPDSFKRGIVHTEVRDTVQRGAYTRLHGVCLYYNEKLNETCRFHFSTQQVRATDTTTAITSIYDLSWEREQDWIAYLSLLECRMAVKSIPWRVIINDDTEYVAIPHANLDRMDRFIKQRFTSLEARFHYTVLFQITHRCLLIPSPLLSTIVIPCRLNNKRWFIFSIRPSLVLRDSMERTIPAHTPYIECALHPPIETTRVQTQVVPQWMALGNGDEWTGSLECVGCGTCDAYVTRRRDGLIVVVEETTAQDP